MRWASLFLASLAITAASAEMMPPNNIPADRVIKNLNSRLAKNPKDGEAEYTLGRIYYNLFCEKDPRTIRLYGTETSPRFPSMHTSPWEFKDLNPSGDQHSIASVQAALKHLQRAIELGGGEPGLYQLTYACAYEASAQLAAKVTPRATRNDFMKHALEAYRASYQESKSRDQKRPTAQMSGTYEKWISTEASESVLRLSPNDPLKEDILAHKKFMQGLPGGPITPIIFSLSSAKTLDQLLDPTAIVAFDLDGTGAPQRYSWVGPDTCILVWHPDPRVVIRSGRQLFGSATWWMMAKNGYAALAMLDDNADGWLTGKELKGLAIWRDRNQNGIAEPAEVLPIMRTAIAKISTRFSGRVGESLVSGEGIELTDGRILPTYDLVTRQSGKR